MNREIRNTVGNAEATLQEKSMVTDITPAHVVALQASLWAGCASVIYMISKVPLATFLDTLRF